MDTDFDWKKWRAQMIVIVLAAVGARVAVRFGDDQQRFDQVVCGKGFLSQNPYPLHFGLGAHDEVTEVLIIWPDGRKQTLNQLAVDQVHRLQQPAP